jgi:polysaccharide export outer membrane protein
MADYPLADHSFESYPFKAGEWGRQRSSLPCKNVGSVMAQRDTGQGDIDPGDTVQGNRQEESLSETETLERLLEEQLEDLTPTSGFEPAIPPTNSAADLLNTPIDSPEGSDRSSPPLTNSIDSPNSPIPNSPTNDLAPLTTDQIVPSFQCPPPSASSNYLLGSGDQVAIVVIGYTEFNSQQIILPDHTVSIPLIGSVSTQGHTPDSLAQALNIQLKRYLVNPCVTVSLTNLRPVLVSVTGEVNRPGPIQLPSAINATLSDAVLAAGGIRRNADLRQVTIRRFVNGERENNGETTDNRETELQLLTVNLWETISPSETLEPTVILRDGDAIFIPRLEQPETIDQGLLARSSLAPPGLRVRLLGEVQRVGEIEVTPNTSISEVLAIAGGVTPDARNGNVTLLRFDESGPPQERKFDLRDLTETFPVQDRDIVIVSKRRLPSILDSAGTFVGRILSPFNTLLFFNSFFRTFSGSGN